MDHNFSQQSQTLSTADHLVGFGEQAFLEFLLGSCVGEWLAIIVPVLPQTWKLLEIRMKILCQDPFAIVVKNEDSLDRVQGWFQQHVFKGHGGLCKIPASGVALLLISRIYWVKVEANWSFRALYRGSNFDINGVDCDAVFANVSQLCNELCWQHGQDKDRQPQAQKIWLCFLM